MLSLLAGGQGQGPSNCSKDWNCKPQVSDNITLEMNMGLISPSDRKVGYNVTFTERNLKNAFFYSGFY